MSKTRILSLLLFFLSIESLAFAQIYLPLEITDYANIDRVDEPVTSGIPLPIEKSILNTRQLSIVDENGEKIAVQFKVVSRWNGTPYDTTRPIKWVLADFRANIKSGQRTYYYLTDRERESQNDGESLEIEDNLKSITVDTGKAKFVVSKEYFNLFDSVYLDNDGNGRLDNLILNNDKSHGLMLKDRNGVAYSSTFEAPEAIAIEENGSQRAVVAIRGVFKNQTGDYFASSLCKSKDYPKFCQPYSNSFFYYNCRIHFYLNKSYARIFITLENNGANGRDNPEQYYAPNQSVYFDNVLLRISSEALSYPTLFTETIQEKIYQNGQVSISQDWKERSAGEGSLLEKKYVNGPFYVINKDNLVIDSGTILSGWFSLNENSERSIGFAMRHFWQNFPKKLIADSSWVDIGLWPEGGYYPYTTTAKEAGCYLFDAGRHKTFEFALGFGMTADEVQQLHLKVEEPLMAMAPPEWYAGSKALGMIAPSIKISHSEQTIAESIDRYEQHAMAMVYSSESEDGVTIFNIKTANPPDNEYPDQRRFFGWMGFGDLLWSGSTPCALHYDWPYAMFLHYLRTKKRAFFNSGVEMVKHRYDIDQYHGDREALYSSSGNHKWLNYVAFYESDAHADSSISSNPSRLSKPTHTWNGGLILYYLLTGDIKSWEAANENGKLGINYYGPSGLKSAENEHAANHETRYETWTMLNLINIYNVNGDPEILQIIKNIAKNRLLYREKLAGNDGHFGENDPPNINPDKQSSTMYAYAVEPLIYAHFVTGDSELKDLLIRMADWTWDEFLFGGDVDEDGKYMPLQCVSYWKKDDPTGRERGDKGEVIKTTFWADLFAYVYTLTGEEKYLNRARQCFKDTMFYYAVHGSKFYNPTTRSQLTFDDSMFPGSHTKIHGWMLRTNQVYLNTEWMLLEDYDQDGMPNQWEETYDLELFLDDSAEDPDHDGISNIQEYLNGTSPVEMDGDACAVIWDDFSLSIPFVSFDDKVYEFSMTHYDKVIWQLIPSSIHELQDENMVSQYLDDALTLHVPCALYDNSVFTFELESLHEETPGFWQLNLESLESQ